jgi:hypothetical protein
MNTGRCEGTIDSSPQGVQSRTDVSDAGRWKYQTLVFGLQLFEMKMQWFTFVDSLFVTCIGI